MRTLYGLLLTVIALSVVAGCSQAPTESRPKAAGNVYEVKGKVTAVDTKKPSVTLDHEDVPGLMKAMTMEFPVADAKVLDGVSVGDAVRGQLRKDETGYLVLSLEKR